MYGVTFSKAFIMNTLQSFTSLIIPSSLHTEKVLWFIFREDDILLQNDSIPTSLDITDIPINPKHQLFMGTYGATPCYVIQANAQAKELPQDFVFAPIRQAHEILGDEALFKLICRAKQLLHWNKISMFCGACGKKTHCSEHERAKICSTCNTSIFPHISPVMMALVWRADEILLARSAHFMPGIYSILAGFVEPGELLEETVHREVMEEVGITIKNLQYVSSQPWPFQSNLMLGFTAEYESGELLIDKKELEDAQWFSIKKLPPLPKPISLARQIIEQHLRLKSAM